MQCESCILATSLNRIFRVTDNVKIPMLPDPCLVGDMYYGAS